MKRPWMPLYVADFIADTTQLSATETGIYIRLIMHCWQHGTIPRDDKKLALIAHCDPRLWRQYQGTVLQFFDVVDASTMHHRRVTKEILRSDEISNKRKDAALQKHSKSTAIAPANGTAIVYTIHNSHLTKKEKKNGAEAPIDLFVTNPPSQEKRYFDRSKEVLGPKGGGLAAKLLKSKGKDVALSMSVLEIASTKSDPAAYIGAVIRRTDRSDMGAQQQPGYGDSWW